MSEWFKTWFESPEYLKLYKHRDEKEAKELVDSILSSIEIQKESEVLDLACGAGRHSIQFAKMGYNVTAVDLSSNLLAIAREYAKKNNVTVNFIRSDLRDFKYDKKFDVVLNLFTSFGYFESDEENFQIFTIAYNFLNNDGYFIFDYFNENHLKKNLIPETILEIGDEEIRQKREIINDRVVKEITINKNGTQENYKESVKIYNKDEIINQLRKIGFTIKGIYGSFNKAEFDDDSSERIIIFSQK